MADYLPENRPFFKEFHLTPVIHSLEDVATANVLSTTAVPLGMLGCQPNTVVLGAYSGHGVAQSVYLGRWAAEVLCGKRSLPDWNFAEEPS